MLTQFNQAGSVTDMLTEDCERRAGGSEMDSRRKQEFSKRHIQGLELHVYIHCYGD